jgi:hypothetical protein
MLASRGKARVTGCGFLAHQMLAILLVMPSRIASASVIVVAIASVSVVGEALPPPGQAPQLATGVLEVAPTKLTFGYQPYGTRSAFKQLTLRSVDGPVRITSVRLDGVAATSFELLSGGEAGQLPENGTRSVELAFAPKQWRPGHEARLVIQTGTTSQSVSLWGASEPHPTLYAVQPSGNPPSVELGSVGLRTASEPKTVTFRNIGPATYRATSGELGPQGLSNWHPQDFRVVRNTCTLPVPPAATCVVGFRFRPTGVDQRVAEYKLMHGKSTRYIKLRGWGNAY